MQFTAEKFIKYILKKVMAKSIYIVLAFLFITVQIQPQTSGKFHTYSGAHIVSGEVRLTRSYTDFKKEAFGFAGMGMYEYYFSSKTRNAFGLRFFTGAGTIAGEGGTNSLRPSVIQEFNSTIFLFGGGGVYSFSINDYVLPYIFAGASMLFFDPKDEDGNAMSPSVDYKKNEINYNGELGIRFLVSKNLTLNLSGSLHSNPSDNLDGWSRGKAYDMFYTIGAGVSYIISAERDSDGDGIEDAVDKCIDTPDGIRVDNSGCPLDSDKDKVPDFLDKCGNTPKGIKVDSKGCPLDSDKDGVADFLDNCKETPVNVKVDAAGCPFDTDNDGVPDYKDQCQNTTPGAKTDEFGCETKSGRTQAPIKKIRKLVLNGSSSFEGDNTVLNQKATEMLSRLIPVMNEYPETRWEIIGHTDNTGSIANNKMISLEKAKSVLEYFVSHGISRVRFDLTGKGSAEPIGDNLTEAGRELNRRVEIINLTMPDSDDTDKGILSQIVYNYSNDRNISEKIYSDGNLFMIEVSTFKSQIEAQRNADKTKALGHNTIVVNQRGSYSVRVGYFNTESEAKEYAEKNFGLAGH